jgi:predicted small secreted protein
MKRILAAVLLAAAALSFAGCKGVGADYVDADEATRQAVDAPFRAYVSADGALDADAKARRLRLLDSWRIRVEKAREALK